ncbi:MAG: MBL fold metallo-hydrolase, partial [Pyrinomonadaceae bacterium]
MKKVLNIMLCFCLVQVCFYQPVAAQQAKSASERSYLQARQVVEAGIKAMGGLQALQSINDVTRELSGTRSDQGQGMQPVPANTVQPPVLNHPKQTSIRDLKNQRAFDETEATIFGGQPFKFRSISNSTTNATLNYVSRTVRESPPAALLNVRAARFRRYPESLLLTVWNRPESLRWLGDGEHEGRKQRVVTFSDSDGSQIALYFDAQTNMLTKQEVIGDDPVLGDITIETIYSDWRPVGKVMLPFRYTDKVGGSVLQDLRAAIITLDAHPADSLFTMPEGFAKLELTPPTPTVKKLSEDVYAILGAYNSIFVVFKDYVLVLEAGANNRYSQSSIAEIRKVAPDKPIRYLVSTHFHFDHLSGVRSYIAEGTTIVTTQSAKSVIEQLAKREHVMRPDALSKKPTAPIIETFQNKRVFDDGAHTVELYQIANPHAGEMIIAYLPKEKILFEADMLDIDTAESGPSAAGEDTADLAAWIQKTGLQIETIVPVHGHPGTLADLQKALANRT